MILWVIPRFVLSAVVSVSAFAAFFFIQPSTSSGMGVALLVNPEFPTPGALTEVSLNDYSVETVGMNIAWYIDGVLDSSFANERTIRLTAGPLGKKMQVRAILSRNGLSIFEATTTIIPTQVDLIIEADTYVPSFYQGRSLPSPESKARAVVVVNDGSKTPASGYTYEWSEDSTVLLGGPMKGKYALDFTVSRFKGKTLGVTVMNTSGGIIGRKEMELNPVEPYILFYEQSPLRGLLERAISRPLPLISEETTVYGEPYFFHTNVSSDQADFSWEIDNVPVTELSQAPNAITLRQVNAGEASVGLRIVSHERIPQVVEKVFRVFLQ